MSATAHDMSQYWRLISTEAANDTHRVYGTWWATREYIKALSVVQAVADMAWIGAEA